MKKSVLTLAAIAVFSIASQAQTFGFQKQDVLLEGSIGVNTTDNKNTEMKASSLNIGPKAGYFLSDKAAVGIALNYGQSKNTDYSGSTDSYTKTNSLGAGIFGRYYFFDLGKRFKVYGEADLSYTSLGGETKSGSVTIKKDKTNTYGISADIGANYFITERIAVGYQFANVIGYSTSRVNKSGAKAFNNFYANLNDFSNFFSTGSFSLAFKL